MVWLVALLLFSLSFGQFGGISIGSGVTVYISDVVVVCIVLYGLITGSLKRSLYGHRLVRPMIAFGAIAVISLLVNSVSVPLEELLKGSLYLVRWVAFGGVYMTLVGSKKHVNLIPFLFASGCMLGIVSLLQFFLYPDLRNLLYLGYDPHYYRVFSTLLDPNFTGIVLVLALISGIYMFVSGKQKLWISVALVVILSALLLTYSRSSYLAFIGGIVTWVVLQKKPVTGFILALLFLVAIVYLPKMGHEALSLDRFDSTVSRFHNWSESVHLISKKPVFGFGFNILPFSTARIASEVSVDTAAVSRSGAGVDNSLLFVGATTGLIGLGAYLWLLAEMIKMGVSVYRKKYTGIKTLYLVSLGAVLVHSLFINSLFYPWVMVWMWVLSAVVEKEQPLISNL